MKNFEDCLRTDFERLVKRVYSEEGIPMFLACENLAPGQSTKEPSNITLTSLNQDLSAALRRDADAWRCIRPDTAPSDLAKIVEILADRDFAAGGTGKNL